MGRSRDNPDEVGAAKNRSRRRFVVGAAKAGSAAGAALWIAPKLSSVALAQTTAGSPPPDSTTTTEPPEVEPTVEEPPQVGRAGEGGGSAAAEPPGGEKTETGGALALTGSDVRTLGLVGGSAVVTGEALLLMRRYLPQTQPALPAGDATDSSAVVHPEGSRPPADPITSP